MRKGDTGGRSGPDSGVPCLGQRRGTTLHGLPGGKGEWRQSFNGGMCSLSISSRQAGQSSPPPLAQRLQGAPLQYGLRWTESSSQRSASSSLLNHLLAFYVTPTSRLGPIRTIFSQPFL